MKKILITLSLVATFSFSEVAGMVNGVSISVKEANEALSKITQGKMTWDKLETDGKKQLINMMAPAILITSEAYKNLTAKEMETALASYWMQKKMLETKVSDDDAKKAYTKMVEMAKKANSKQQIPTFDMVKDRIKMQLSQEKVVGSLMKDAKILVR